MVIFLCCIYECSKCLYQLVLFEGVLLPVYHMILCYAQDWMFTVESLPLAKSTHQQGAGPSYLGTIAEEKESAAKQHSSQAVTVGCCLAFILGLEVSDEGSRLPCTLTAGKSVLQITDFAITS